MSLHAFTRGFVCTPDLDTSRIREAAVHTESKDQLVCLVLIAADEIDSLKTRVSTLRPAAVPGTAPGYLTGIGETPCL